MRKLHWGGDHRSEAGFTIVEMVVVTTVLSILATIAVPNLVRSSATANESAVIATLRAISSAQMQFEAQHYVDVDGDGNFEYATLKEITGAQPLRSGGTALAPGLLSVPLSLLNAAGRLHRHGYYFALYLPDTAGVGLPETEANRGSIAPELAADYWTCVAWPHTYGQTGHDTFFVNQQGQILRAPEAKYSGKENAPPAGAALRNVPPERIDSRELAVEAVGADGNRWVAVN
jgi:prepilin-type N-terminal cleavage/methylation domain-containing protein